MKREYAIPKYQHMIHGCDYNPDQWQNYPEILNEDIRLFKLANLNEMTLGIFSWAALEPEEGKFDFSFLDKAMDDVYAAGGRVILATPSGSRPHWLSDKYPEVLRYTENFVQRKYGRRHNHCYTSEIFREKVRIIDTKLAERYKDHPALIAWHISNELSGECYCPLCQQTFRDWLKNKYKTIDNLNHIWWNGFWAHNYSDWSQIDPPSNIGENSVHALKLDWKRFVTEQTSNFLEHEIATVKAVTPNIPVTTNLMMGFYDVLDYRRVNKNVDFSSVDIYPKWKGNDADDINVAIETALDYDATRSYKHKPFLLMESAPGAPNWFPYNRLTRAGQHELVSMQSVAHGADSVQYFQFRKCRGGFEKFHGAVVDHEGSENTRIFKEISALGKKLLNLDEVVGTMPDSRVAIIHDWSNKWALDDAAAFYRRDKKLLPTVTQFYKSLWTRGIDTDIIGFEDDFANYSFIIAPMLYTVSEEVGKKLTKFVENGGTLLCTYMTAMVDENDLCHLGGFPGAGLRKVFGIWNEEIDTLYPEQKVLVKTENGECEAVDYCELIHTEGAKVIAEYASEFYAGMPAATVNEYGKGKAYYIAFRDKGEFTEKIMEKILSETKISSKFCSQLPYGVTAHSREDDKAVYVFLQNFTRSEQTVTPTDSWSNIENNEVINKEFVLLPYETKILKKLKV